MVWLPLDAEETWPVLALAFSAVVVLRYDDSPPTAWRILGALRGLRGQGAWRT